MLKLASTFIVLSLVALIIVLQSCSTDTSSNAVTPVSKHSSISKSVELKFTDAPFYATAEIYQGRSKDYCKILLEASDFNKLDLLKKYNINSDGKIYSYILFNKGTLTENNSIMKNDISAIGIYYLHEGKLMFKFYNVGLDGNYIELPEIETEVSGISTGDLQFIAKRLIPSFIGGKNSIIHINLTNEAPNLNSRISRQEDNLLIKTNLYYKSHFGRYIPFNKGKVNLQETDKPKSCGPGCDYYQVNTHCVDNGYVGPYTCDLNGGGPCSIITTKNDLATAQAIGTDTLNTAFDYNLLYQFRDTTLSYTDFGLKLTAYYYRLSKNLDTISVPLSLKIQSAYTLYNFRSAMVKLLNPGSYGSSIFIDSTLKTQLIDLLNAYKALSTDTTYLAILNDIIDDINYYQGMTVNQFISATVAETEY